MLASYVMIRRDLVHTEFFDHFFVMIQRDLVRIEFFDHFVCIMASLLMASLLIARQFFDHFVHFVCIIASSLIARHGHQLSYTAV
jgi:hypothetical protein